MATNTTNYKLILPAANDNYDVDDFNANFSTIDAQLKANADAAAAAQGAADEHTHGSLTHDGKIGTLANKAVYTGAGGALQAGTLPVAAGGTGGTTAGDRRAGSPADIHEQISSYICMVIGQHLYGFPVSGGSGVYGRNSRHVRRGCAFARRCA